MKIPNFLKNIFFGIPIGITVIDCFGYVARVDGISMQPALNPDKNLTDYVFLNKWAVKSYNIKRGDIISLISPKDPSQKIIKRVVGVEGDIIATLGYKKEIVKVPEGHCWIEGDHTGHSMDSNNFGPVSVGLITARASCIVWPPSRWQFIQSFLPDSRVPLNLLSKSFIVKKVEFEFSGNVVRNALTLGDIDNDGCNELIVGNQNGDVAIFKGQEKMQTISKLSFISCVAVGDVLNENRNVLVIITADGWCYVYAAPERIVDTTSEIVDVDEGVEQEYSQLETVFQVDGQIQSTSGSGSFENLVTDTPVSKQGKNDDKMLLLCIHRQRIPANAKNILLGDVDGDGMVEMVLGLTDRVVRSYRWISNNSGKSPIDITIDPNSSFEHSDKLLGKFVALNKWECANQIGSITLHHSLDGKASLLIAQPGGTFMRIRCPNEESINFAEVETSEHSNSSGSQGENIPSSVDYQFLGISRMRNQNISTEILGDLKCSPCDSFDKCSITTQISDSSKSVVKGRPYAVATLDGTIMLVQDEVILWAIAVDHQVFALTKLDITGNGCDDIVVCCWDGQTYILDQDKNSVRFHLDEPVQAFESGYYSIKSDEPAVTCLVYVTFKNKIILYYDIPLREFICKKFEPDPEKLSELFLEEGRTPEEALEIVMNMDRKTKRDLVEYLLYSVKP